MIMSEGDMTVVVNGCHCGNFQPNIHIVKFIIGGSPLGLVPNDIYIYLYVLYFVFNNIHITANLTFPS